MARIDTRALGSRAEKLAARFLEDEGLRIIARNFRCRLGEIDLIARHERHLVFVEVRYRGASAFSRAGISVDVHKQRKLLRTAALFAAARPRYANNVMRFDVVAIDRDKAGETSIEWFRDAFRPNDSRL